MPYLYSIYYSIYYFQVFVIFRKDKGIASKPGVKVKAYVNIYLKF